MSIEFRCDQCENLLRTGEDSRGKKALCPQCGNIQTVPELANALSPEIHSSPELHSPASEAPGTDEFGRSLPQNPFALDPSPNPYEASATSTVQPASPTSIRSKLIGPAISLLVVSILGFLLTALVVVGGIINVVTEGMTDEDASMLVIFSVSLVLLLIAIAGSIQMLRQRGYGLAMTAVVLSLVPISCTWCVSLPFGIWGLVVLLDDDVRNAFRRGGDVD